MGVLHNKYIPKEYIYTDKQSRLEFLAGIIDTDGSYDSKKHNFEIAQKDPAIVYDIIYICRSLGLKTTVSEKIIRGVTYYRIFILSGCHLIPTKINRKKQKIIFHYKRMYWKLDLILNLLVEVDIMDLK